MHVCISSFGIDLPLTCMPPKHLFTRSISYSSFSRETIILSLTSTVFQCFPDSPNRPAQFWYSFPPYWLSTYPVLISRKSLSRRHAALTRFPNGPVFAVYVYLMTQHVHRLPYTSISVQNETFFCISPPRSPPASRHAIYLNFFFSSFSRDRLRLQCGDHARRKSPKRNVLEFADRFSLFTLPGKESVRYNAGYLIHPTSKLCNFSARNREISRGD